MGLSISPVVATVLAAVGTSLLALLGLKDSSADAAGRLQTYTNSFAFSVLVYLPSSQSVPAS